MSSGGKREGAGRPTMNPDRKRKRIDIHVAPETAERIKGLREKGVIIGRHVDQLVNDLCEEFGIS